MINFFNWRKEIEQLKKIIEEKDRKIDNLNESISDYYHNQNDYVCENPVCLSPYRLKNQIICEKCDSAFCSVCGATDGKTCVLCTLELIRDKDLLDFLIKKHSYINEEQVKDLYRREKDDYKEPEDFPISGFCCEISREHAITQYYRDLKEKLHRSHKCNDYDCDTCNWRM